MLNSALEGMKTIHSKRSGTHEQAEKIKELEKQVWERTEEIKVASVTLENLRTIRKELEAKLHYLLTDPIRMQHALTEVNENEIRNAALEEAAKLFDGYGNGVGWFYIPAPSGIGCESIPVAARIREKKKP